MRRRTPAALASIEEGVPPPLWHDIALPPLDRASAKWTCPKPRWRALLAVVAALVCVILLVTYAALCGVVSASQAALREQLGVCITPRHLGWTMAPHLVVFNDLVLWRPAVTATEGRVRSTETSPWCKGSAARVVARSAEVTVNGLDVLTWRRRVHVLRAERAACLQHALEVLAGRDAC